MINWIAQSNQQILENGLQDNITEERYVGSLKYFQESMPDSVEKLLEDTGTDVIIMASSESLLPIIVDAVGHYFKFVRGWNAYRS